MKKNNVYVTVTKDVAEARFITHGGVFHADDVLSSVALAMLHGDISVARVFRVPEETDAFVYDIGWGAYDHHQTDNKPVRENGIPYAAFGLIWRDFGKEILSRYECPEPLLEAVEERIEESFVQPVDGRDNGFKRFDDDVRPAYRSFELSDAIAKMNANWDDEETPDEAFERACAFAFTAFDATLRSTISAAKAEGVVRDSIARSKDGVMELEQYVPWQRPLFEDETGKADSLLYVVFPSIRGGYNVQAVPASPESFECRKAFPEAWRGKPAESGIEACTFVHSNGFLASCRDRESAFALAAKAIAF